LTEAKEALSEAYSVPKVFFSFDWHQNRKSPYPPVSKWGKLMELLVKSPFGKGGSRGIYWQSAGIFGRRYLV
jgi:hypothetical protein